jgi:hypothetical protein
MRYVVRAVLAAVTLALAAAPARAQQAAPVETAPVKKTPSSDAAPPRKPHYVSDPIPRRGFNVVLLLGDMQGADAQDSIPVAARKALTDMKDFLPYKYYRLLDTQWIIGASSGPAVTRLRGVDDQEYELELRVSSTLTPGTAALSPTGMSVHFVLRDSGDVAVFDKQLTPLHPKEVGKLDSASLEISREIFQLERERDDLRITTARKRSQVEVGTADPVEVQRMEQQLTAVTRRIADLKQASAASSAKAAGRAVIDTSFRMDDGETVVVGTSKVKGSGKALIALLTATADRKVSTK